jgi:DNA-directed RNA polymerase specialized sigma24 family protein
MKTSVVSISGLDNLTDGATPPQFLPKHLRGRDNARRIRYLKRELRRVIENCLTEKQREYLMKHYWHGMRRSDIAREHGVGAAQITKSIGAAQKIIQERLDGFLAIYDRLERDLLDEL